jgi:molybdenum cofactor guanylyltransferase
MNGLVIAGGKSSRMGTNKAFLQYFHKPQYQIVFDLLHTHCEKVFIGLNAANDLIIEPKILDLPIYKDIGPMASILSAFAMEKTDWMVMAIDYPFIKADHLQLLISQFFSKRKTSVLYNNETNFYEPFIGIYEKSFNSILLRNVNNNNFSMQEILQTTNIEKISIENTNLQSVDTFELYQSIINSKGE